LLTLLGIVACKQDSGAVPAPSARPSASVAASTSATVATGPIAFAGAYSATPGVLFVPDAAPWEHVKFRGDDAGAVGDGTLTFAVDRDSGALSGDLQGPLGPATLSGFADEKSLSFHITPRDATDMAFSGTGTGTVDGGSANGELHVSSWRANVLRDATFRAQKH